MLLIFALTWENDRKILRSLQERFKTKVSVIKKRKNVDMMKEDELVSSLQSYEMASSILKETWKGNLKGFLKRQEWVYFKTYMKLPKKANSKWDSKEGKKKLSRNETKDKNSSKSS